MAIFVLPASQLEATLRRREHVTSRFFKTLEQRLGIRLELRKRFMGTDQGRSAKAVSQMRKFARQASIAINGDIDF